MWVGQNNSRSHFHTNCTCTVCRTHHALRTGSCRRWQSRGRWSREAWLVQRSARKSFCISLWQREVRSVVLDVGRKASVNTFLWDVVGHLLHVHICMRGHHRWMRKCGMRPLWKPIYSILTLIWGFWIAWWVYALGLHRQWIVGCICHGIPSLGWYSMAEVWRKARKRGHGWHHRRWQVRGGDKGLSHAHGHGEHVCQGEKWRRLWCPHGRHVWGHGIAIGGEAGGIGHMRARRGRCEVGGVTGDVWLWGGARVWWVQVGHLSRGGHNGHWKLLHVAKIWKRHGGIRWVCSTEWMWSS